MPEHDPFAASFAKALFNNGRNLGLQCDTVDTYLTKEYRNHLIPCSGDILVDIYRSRMSFLWETAKLQVVCDGDKKYIIIGASYNPDILRIYESINVYTARIRVEHASDPDVYEFPYIINMTTFPRTLTENTTVPFFGGDIYDLIRPGAPARTILDNYRNKQYNKQPEECLTCL